MFDEEPDGDPHGECAAEISRLNAELKATGESLRLAMDTIRQQNEEIARLKVANIKAVAELETRACASADMCNEEGWCANGCERTKKVSAGDTATFPDGMTPEDDRRFNQAWNIGGMDDETR